MNKIRITGFRKENLQEIEIFINYNPNKNHLIGGAICKHADQFLEVFAHKLLHDWIFEKNWKRDSEEMRFIKNLLRDVIALRQKRLKKKLKSRIIIKRSDALRKIHLAHNALHNRNVYDALRFLKLKLPPPTSKPVWLRERL